MNVKTLFIVFLLGVSTVWGGFEFVAGSTSTGILVSFGVILLIIFMFGMATAAVTLNNKIFFLIAYAFLPIVYSVIFWASSQSTPCIYISGKTLIYADYLYFSVITITGLGYADLYPLGTCRYIAGLEAFMGFTFLPIVISLAVADILQ